MPYRLCGRVRKACVRFSGMFFTKSLHIMCPSRIRVEYEQISLRVKKNMSQTILQSVPVGEKVGIAFSGGLDTELRAALDEDQGRASLCLYGQPCSAR